MGPSGNACTAYGKAYVPERQETPMTCRTVYLKERTEPTAVQQQKHG